MNRIKYLPYFMAFLFMVMSIGTSATDLKTLCLNAGEGYLYTSNVKISKINSSIIFKMSSMYPTVHVMINNAYYIIDMNKGSDASYPASGENIASLANMAYTTRAKVNACTNKGFLWGLEF